MKTVYDALNDCKVDPKEYEVRRLTEAETETMKQNFHRAAGLHSRRKMRRWPVVAAACLVCAIGFSQTAYAKNAVGILQSVFLGHNSVVQMDPNAETSKDDLSGYYDKNGKPLTAVNPGGTTDLYDAKGNKVGTIGSTKSGSAGVSNSGTAVEKDLNKAVAQLTFQPLLPKDLPAGYVFDRAELYRHDNGKADGDYVDLYYKNGADEIAVQERRISQKTTYTFATDDKVQAVTVNGHPAALTGGHDLDWEAGGVSVGVVAKAVPTDQLMKLAESMK